MHQVLASCYQLAPTKTTTGAQVILQLPLSECCITPWTQLWKWDAKLLSCGANPVHPFLLKY